jgi:hypothetical protein
MEFATVRRGLSQVQAFERLTKFGPNEIEATEASGWLRILRGVATEPMFVLLVAAAAVYSRDRGHRRRDPACGVRRADGGVHDSSTSRIAPL